MKIKKFEKQMVLTKQTIANLNNGQLGIVKGGIISEPYYSCVTQCIGETCPLKYQCEG
jgi:hypothetical protein